MKKFHHILAAIDFTPSCLRALRAAVHRASLDEAKLTAVHVMDEYLVEELKTALSTSETAVRAEWEAKLKKFVDDAEIGSAAVQMEVRVGHPFAELVDACHAHGADLLVMGAKGSSAEPSRLGAITAKCIRKAPVDVLVVRHDASLPFKQVLACVDFSENSAKAVQCALHVAEQDKSELTCLYVFQSALATALDYGGFVTPLPPVVSDDQALGLWQKELDTFLEPLLHKAGGVPLKKIVDERVNIREAILDHVESTHTDLVVLGTQGKNTLRHLLIGTTAEKIVQHAPCSLLAVKPDDFVIPAGDS